LVADVASSRVSALLCGFATTRMMSSLNVALSSLSK
jgi:hypothetical protein